MNSIEEQAYIEGFMSKCAEHGINKEAQVAKLLGGARKGLTGYWNALTGSRARAADELSSKLTDQLFDTGGVRRRALFMPANRIVQLDDRVASLLKRRNKVDDMAAALRSQRDRARTLTAAGAAGGVGAGVQAGLQRLEEERNNLG